jgi:AcrR family transcriptional regulator
MKNMKTDRRSERTREQLRMALLEMMSAKLYGEITVQDILDRANIGRSTFYGHFVDKDDLLANSLQLMIRDLHYPSLAATGKPTTLLPSLELFRHVKQQQRLYKALIWGRGIDLVAKNLQAQLSVVVEQNLRIMKPDLASPNLAAVSNFVAGAFLNLLTWWMDDHVDYTPEEIDALFRALVQPGVRQVLQVNFL